VFARWSLEVPDAFGVSRAFGLQIVRSRKYRRQSFNPLQIGALIGTAVVRSYPFRSLSVSIPFRSGHLLGRRPRRNFGGHLHRFQSPSDRGTYWDGLARLEATMAERSFNPLQIGALIGTWMDSRSGRYRLIVSIPFRSGHLLGPVRGWRDGRPLASFNPLQIGALIGTALDVVAK
jgi:hypothetical protein